MELRGNESTMLTDNINKHLFGIRTLFYAITPNESSYDTLDQVPKIVDQASIYFFLLQILEVFVLYLQGSKHRLPRWNDMFSSLACGVISQIPWLIFHNIELTYYIWLHDNYCIYKLPWDSAWTWWFCMLGVDLGYYWVHRFAHEVNFMWAGHQTHHSSEDYNLSTALRQGVFQKFSSWIFYLPLAFFIPPSIFLIHLQLNLLYQFWIHTETINKLGPLEYILNTPSHHRVHHGVNRYCIDKNYAGVLIIWDRMFGTFVPENKSDEVVYGLTHQLESWNPIYAQLSHWLYMLSTIRDMKGISNKISFLVKGPGWAPGKPRLGLIEDIPDVHAPAKKFSKTVKGSLGIYCVVHFVLVLVLYETITRHRQDFSDPSILLTGLFILWTLTDIGFLYEGRSKAVPLEIIRCLVVLISFALLSRTDTAKTFPPIVYLTSGAAILSIPLLVIKLVSQPTGVKKDK